jgi:hypothetical protein
MITSVAEPPIWKPKLPPSIMTVPGADQTPTPARHVTFSVLAPDQESRALLAGDDYDALGVGQQVFRDAFIRCRHDLGEHDRGFVEPLYRIVVFGQQGRNRQGRDRQSSR